MASRDVDAVIAEYSAQPLGAGEYDFGVAGDASGPNLTQQGFVDRDTSGVPKNGVQELVLGRRQIERAVTWRRAQSMARVSSTNGSGSARRRSTARIHAVGSVGEKGLTM